MREKCTCSRAGMNKRYCDCKKLNAAGYMQKKIKQRNWAGSSASMGRGVSQAIPLSARGRYLNLQGVSGCPSGCSPCYNGVGCCNDGAPETPCSGGARQSGRRPSGRRPMSRKELDKRISKYKSFSGNYKGLQERLNKNFGLGYRNYFVNLADLKVEF